MRGADTFTESLFTMRKLEDFVPARHPLREIRKMANAALAKLGPELTAMYAAEVKGGRPGIAPEKLLRAMLLQVLYSVRSERHRLPRLTGKEEQPVSYRGWEDRASLRSCDVVRRRLSYGSASRGGCRCPHANWLSQLSSNWHN